MANDFQYDVFLSHSARDKAIVRPIAERLRKDGVRVWFDDWEIRPGDNIPAKIEEGLEHSRVLVLCMSANAFGSDWVTLESQTFRFRDPLNKDRRFIPLRLDAASIKGSLAQFLYIDWHLQDREQEYAKLLDACRQPETWPVSDNSLSTCFWVSTERQDEDLIGGYARANAEQLLADCSQMIRCLAGFDTVFLMSPQSAAEQAQRIEDAWFQGFNHAHEMLCLAATTRKIDLEAYRQLANSAYAFWRGGASTKETEANLKRLFSPGIDALHDLKRALMVEIANVRNAPFESATSTKPSGEIMKVLALFANPKGTNTLRLGEEHKTLQECIRRSKNRDQIELIVRYAVTVDDIRRALLDGPFEVIHFSGHGTGTGLAFEDASGRLFVPPQDAIAELLASFSPPLQCVVLNACYSLEQGTFASLGVPYTVAMEGPITDDGVIVFSGGFYDSLAAGRDVEFSFRQGVLALKLAKHPDCSVPRLIRKGESLVVEKAQREPRAGSRNTTELAEPILVGVALDVSGSMEASINNRVGGRESRLEAFQKALQEGTQRSREFLNSVERMDAPVRIFSYAFGLRAGDVCDLFSMMKAAEGVISTQEIETLKQRFTAEITHRYSSNPLAGYESLARNFLGSRAVDSFITGARANAEAEVRGRILSEVQHRLSARLAEIGDTTITLNELVELWKGSRQSFADAEALIFGQTPMCGALQAIKGRFARELGRYGPEKPATVLLLVSDGESTDGDPLELAEQIKSLGATVIGCYITDHDVVDSRHLLNSTGQNWPKGAKDMFRMASELPVDSVFARHLLREGWRLSNNARAFVQANHSEVLRELVSLALCPVEAGSQLLPKGR